MSKSVTRGHGRLERFLSKKRAQVANQLIPDPLRSGAILDIGCGTYPYFLINTRFAKKTGLDQVSPDASILSEHDIELLHLDTDESNALPFEDAAFDVVTMLAVFEHIPRRRLGPLLDEVARLLRPGGIFVMTTPTSWTGPILDVLARIGAVSSEEIDEHEDSYSRKMILDILADTAMGAMPTDAGYFELGMNQWVRVSKPED